MKIIEVIIEHVPNKPEAKRLPRKNRGGRKGRSR